MVTVTHEEDKKISVDSSGRMTIKRYMQFEADRLNEIAISTALPQIESRHPELTGFYLNSIDLNPNGNRDRKVQALAVLSYVNSSTSRNVLHFGGEPWELDAQNVNIDYIEMPKPLTAGTKADGTIIQNLNSANCRILAETTESVMILSFTYSVKARTTNDLVTNFDPIINKTSTKVAGIEIPEFMGKLMPLKSTYVVEYENGGTRVKRRYWNYSAQIQIRATGWAKKELDVGTMCYWKNSDGIIVPKPSNIYRYTPWKSSSMADNLKVAPKFGSIDDVIAAQKAYWQASGADKTERIPYEEITEPMPLRPDGTLYEEALENPLLYPYNEIEIYDCNIGSWEEYNLPKKEA